MRLEVSFSLPGSVTLEEACEKAGPLFAPDTGFTVQSLDYEYLDFPSIQSGQPISTTVSVIAWNDMP